MQLEANLVIWLLSPVRCWEFTKSRVAELFACVIVIALHREESE